MINIQSVCIEGVIRPDVGGTQANMNFSLDILCMWGFMNSQLLI